jgi:hypothetical protein
MATPSAGWHEITPSMELEDVFLHFLSRFETLPVPRSAAEICVTSDEFGDLKLWFSEGWGKPRMWCEDTFQIAIANQIFASRQEMFGALLLILASEVCRGNSNEDSVWPAVTAVLKADKVSFPALFVAGQPTTACKRALAAGARRLNMRNLIDRYGAQEYFDTLKLQFGFTRPGAARRLPEWLDGVGPPIAVRILTGAEPEYEDLRSSTFTSLWNALQDFRLNRVSGEYTSALIERSPWIRPDWALGLMAAAKLRPTRSPALLDAQEILDRPNERVCEMLLRWDYPSKPQLSLRLNEERICEILGESDTAIFAIDGRVVDRWTAQENGGWRGRRELPCQPPGAKDNLRPKLLSISSAGSLLEEIDLFEMGTGEPLLVFDLKLGTPVNLTSRLDPSRDYALICDTDLSVPSAAQCLKLKDRSAYWLASPWDRDVQVVCGGAQYWQPRIEQREPPLTIRLTLQSLPGEIAEIGSDCCVSLTGVPEDATVVSLIAGESSYSMTRNGAAWQTSSPLRITLGMALGEERVRIRVSGPSCARTVTPKFSLSLRGIACFESESNTDAEPKWTPLDRHRPLNRADGSGRARVFTETAQSQLFEGSRFVGKISPRALQLRDLCGWGSALIIRAERQPDTILVESVVDYGRGKFLPPLFNGKTAACLSWRTSTCPSNGHQILVWSDLFQGPRRFGADEISSQQDDTLWKLPGLGSVAALAVAYKGVRIASYWHTQLTIDALRNARSSALFPLLRWLKVPILNSSFRAPMEEAALQAPAELVRGWLRAETLQYGLVHQHAEQGLDAVIRELLWNHADRNEARAERLARAFPGDSETRSDGEDFKSLLWRLGDICPSLSYNLAKHKLRGDKYRKYARAVAAAMLQLPADCLQLRDRLTAACRDCANLIGIAPEALEAHVNAFGDHLDNQASNYKQAEADLRRLGETLRGRQLLTASLLLRLAETGGYFGEVTGTKLYRAPCPKHALCNDPSQCTQQACPNCATGWGASPDDADEDDRDLQIQPLRGAERLALSVATETVLYGMPVYPDASRDWKPGKGRRLLCFSDSRREAARLGPLLTSQHEIWVIRSAIVNTLATYRSASATYLNRQIQRYDADAADATLPQVDRDAARRTAADLRQQLSTTASGIPFTEFARSFAEGPHVCEILDRELAEKYSEWRQERWKENLQSVASHAEALIAQEVDNPLRTAVSTEAVGLLELVYPGLVDLPLPARFEERLPGDEIRSRLAAAWPDILAALIDTLRADRTVDWSKDEAGRIWNGESPLYKRWSTRSKNGWTARRFIGDDSRPKDTLQLRLWFAKTLLTGAHCSESLSSALLEAAFDQLYEGAATKRLTWLRCEPHEVGRGETDQAIQILLDQLRLRVPDRLYRCTGTGTFWPRSILGWAPLRGCLGQLQEITHAEADGDPRWGRARRELRGFDIFAMGLWGEEHSAQLSPEENKRRQFLFKDGARNLLSSTTTMELGIDIGGLNGVVLGNVPPGRANHMQRAGRAGRRADGSSVVLTFARNRAFDREVFVRFRDFLQRDLRRPVVFLDRPRFVRRHLHAMLLAEFFAPMQSDRVGAMLAYSNMGNLCGVDSPPKWSGSAKPDWPSPGSGSAEEFTRFLEPIRTPLHLFRRRCRNVAQDTPLCSIADDDGAWEEFLLEAESQFLDACKEWQRGYDSLRSAWDDIRKDPPSAALAGERAKANSIRYQLGATSAISVIEWFSDAGFLPRYGFPIHLQRLSVRVSADRGDKSTTAEGYRLERTSLLALNEYVPGAQVLVAGKIVESQGILKHWTEANRDEALGLNHWALRCSNEHDYLATSQDELCKECGQPPQDTGQALMFPRFGYTTAAWDPPKPPGRNLDRVGKVKLTPAGGFTLSAATKEASNFGEITGLMATYYEAGQGQLLLRNAGGEAFSELGHGFAVCTRCGFAMSEEKPSNAKSLPALQKKFRDHASVFSSNPMTRCWPNSLQYDPVLRHKVLAAKETTDVLILDWPADSDKASLYSLGRALVLAGTRLLELDSRELDLELKARVDGRLGILLYDTVPGGAGHCLELLNLGRPWLEAARNILLGSPSHDAACRRACLECLLDFGGQFHAELLDRKGALNLIGAALPVG